MLLCSVICHIDVVCTDSNTLYKHLKSTCFVSDEAMHPTSCCSQLFGDCWHMLSESEDESYCCNHTADEDTDSEDVTELTDDEEAHPSNNYYQNTIPILSLSNTRFTCVVCNRKNKLILMPPSARAAVVIAQNIIIPAGAKCCSVHLIGGKLKPGIKIDESKLQGVTPTE